MAKLPSTKDAEAIWRALRTDLKGKWRPEVIPGVQADGSLRRYLAQPNSENYEALRKRAALYARDEPGRRRGQKTQISLDHVVTELDRERARILTDHFARLASSRDEVKSLRGDLFGGRLLTLEEAELWLQQAALRYFHVGWFTHNKISILNHKSYIIDTKLGIIPYWTTDTVIRIEWDGQCLEKPGAWRIDIDAYENGVKLKLPRGDLDVHRSSVLGDVQAAASMLAKHYGWSEADATVFIITGTPPRVSAIEVSQERMTADDHSHSTFELHIQPWTSTRSVRQAFRQVQMVALGSQVSPIRERALALFDFIEDFREKEYDGKSWTQINEERVDFSWARAAELWNETQAPSLGKYTGSNMSRDFERTFYAIVWPPVKPMAARRTRPPNKEQ